MHPKAQRVGKWNEGVKKADGSKTSRKALLTQCSLAECREIG